MNFNFKRVKLSLSRLNREATSDRISLGLISTLFIIFATFQMIGITLELSGITTVLTMTFLGLEARKDLPKV